MSLTIQLPHILDTLLWDSFYYIISPQVIIRNAIYLIFSIKYVFSVGPTLSTKNVCIFSVFPVIFIIYSGLGMGL